MKHLLIASFIMLASVVSSQTTMQNKTVVAKFDSTYAGPRFGTGSKKFAGNLKTKNENNFSKLWNQLTPENEGKWGRVGTTPDSVNWNWGPITDLYNYAKSHNIKFKYHTLIWGNQQPEWISDLSQDEKLKYINTWIRQIGIRFPDMEMVDVVNEALPQHFPPNGEKKTANYKDALGGDGKTGYDWVIKSFELARKNMPNSKLLINEFYILNSDTNTTTYLEIINLLKDRGLLDGIGVQGHRGEIGGVPVSTLKRNLDRLAATGLPVYLSEIDLGNIKNEGEPNDQEQLELYQTIFPVLWEHPGVAGITFWGYVEGRMWKKNCHLVRTDGTWRPAMIWLAKYLTENPR